MSTADGASQPRGRRTSKKAVARTGHGLGDPPPHPCERLDRLGRIVEARRHHAELEGDCDSLVLRARELLDELRLVRLELLSLGAPARARLRMRSETCCRLGPQAGETARELLDLLDVPSCGGARVVRLAQDDADGVRVPRVVRDLLAGEGPAGARRKGHLDEPSSLERRARRARARSERDRALADEDRRRAGDLLVLEHKAVPPCASCV